ncbi:hydroxyphenylacetyl-CoA thioesterase PaaI [Blastococcus sp. TF02-09]|uniref:hydroxyphenylacetyl-CoA thioesterase PaaI n=1 Tax=Blastococcus sp. TF02-09 TaxID=2250576 RepID=UPI000DE926EA|nr:hydroxyphenylacetyl-CoA thioesterase PaaI [Blastococcus sp. TF02-9]RBY81334.1 hydroxyphenylacetyl-CoA thioesterase PaaI [Blastococcus sp. TF02-9]
MSGDPAAQAAAEDAVRRFLADDATARALGITVSGVAPGVVRTHMVIRPAMLNGHGTAHGAALFALGDIAFAMACNSHGLPAVGRSCSIEYLAPAAEGDAVTASAVERSVVGRTGIYDVAIVRDADGQLLAEMRGHSRVVAHPT